MGVWVFSFEAETVKEAGFALTGLIKKRYFKKPDQSLANM